MPRSLCWGHKVEVFTVSYKVKYFQFENHSDFVYDIIKQIPLKHMTLGAWALELIFSSYRIRGVMMKANLATNAVIHYLNVTSIHVLLQYLLSSFDRKLETWTIKICVDLIVLWDIRSSWGIHFKAQGAFKSLCELVDQVVSSLAEIVHLFKRCCKKSVFYWIQVSIFKVPQDFSNLTSALVTEVYAFVFDRIWGCLVKE